MGLAARIAGPILKATEAAIAFSEKQKSDAPRRRRSVLR